MCAGIISTAAE